MNFRNFVAVVGLVFLSLIASCKKDGTLSKDPEFELKEQLLLKHGFKKTSNATMVRTMNSRTSPTYLELKNWLENSRSVDSAKGQLRTTSVDFDPDGEYDNAGNISDETVYADQKWYAWSYTGYASKSLPNYFVVMVLNFPASISDSKFYYQGANWGDWSYDHWSASGFPGTSAIWMVSGLCTESFTISEISYQRLWRVEVQGSGWASMIKMWVVQS